MAIPNSFSRQLREEREKFNCDYTARDIKYCTWGRGTGVDDADVSNERAKSAR
jgi:hypothetical protein